MKKLLTKKQQDGVFMKRVSKTFYLISIYGGIVIGLVLIGVAIGLMNTYSRDMRMIGVVLLIPAIGVLIYAIVMRFVLLYKMWKAIQSEYSRTTPGAAVGFLFIPFFNLYWTFQAWYGWALDYNKLISARNVNGKKVPEGLALALCIMNVVLYFISSVGGENAVLALVCLLVGLVSSVVEFILVFKIINGINVFIDNNIYNSTNNNFSGQQPNNRYQPAHQSENDDINQIFSNNSAEQTRNNSQPHSNSAQIAKNKVELEQKFKAGEISLDEYISIKAALSK